MTDKVMTPVFRASFCHLFEKTTPKGGGKPHYSITMIFEDDADLSDMKRIVQQALTEKFGDTQRPGKIKNPFRKGTSEEYDLIKYPEYNGKIVTAARAYNQPPGVLDQKSGQTIISPDDIYSGCYCRASVTAYYYDVSGNKGVAFGLQNVLKIKDGDKLVKRSTPEEDFADLMNLPTAVGAVNDDIFDL